MSRMEISEIAEMVKPHLQNARVLVSLNDGFPYVQWFTRDGIEIADWQLGIPGGCSNNPFTQYPTGRGILSMWWDHLSLEFGGRYLNTYWELQTNDVLQGWLNTNSFIASESLYVGRHITRGTWHSGKNRWMFGPKEDRC